jgi:hypothetical protein
MLGAVNFHTKPQRRAWAEYSVVAVSLMTAFAVLAGS